jgi:hypothetical protein
MDNSRPVSDYTLKQQQKLSNAWTGVQEAVGLKPEEFRQPAFDQWELERVEEAWNKMLAAMGRSTNFTAMFANIHKPPANLLAVGQHAIQRHYKQITSFGEVLNRKVIGVEVRKELPMYPDGKYVVVTYDYNFSKKNDFLLNVVVTLDAEQGAKVLTLQRRFVSKMRSDEDAGR